MSGHHHPILQTSSLRHTAGIPPGLEFHPGTWLSAPVQAGKCHYLLNVLEGVKEIIMQKEIIKLRTEFIVVRTPQPLAPKLLSLSYF